MEPVYTKEESSTFNLSELVHKQNAIMYPFIESLIPIALSECSFLDVGCGGGTLLHYLANKGLKLGVGTEISPEQIAICEALGDKQVKYYQRDGREKVVEEEGPFDVVASKYVVPHMGSPEEMDALFLNQWANLKEGGTLLCVANVFDHASEPHVIAANYEFLRKGWELPAEGS